MKLELFLKRKLEIPFKREKLLQKYTQMEKISPQLVTDFQKYVKIMIVCKVYEKS